MSVKEVKSAEEMFQLGKELARLLARPNLILALHGDLGAGKTTFLKGFISEAAKVKPDEIQSPTFTYLQTYGEVHHFDLYRMQNCHQFVSAGFADYLQTGGICCIEWADRIESLLPSNTLSFEITYQGPCQRLCTWQEKGP